MSTRRGVLAAVALALAAGGCGADKLDPPRPRAVGTWRDTLPPVPESSMDGPLLYPLAPALAWLDTAIPPRLGDLEHRRESPDDSRLRYAYELRRDPFVLSVRGQSATLRTDIAYRVRAWYNLPVLPEVGTSCGEEGEGPRARVAVTMEVRLTPEWRLLPRSRASVDPLSETDDDKCTITPLEIDVTDDVVKAARGALQQKADEVNARLAAVDVPAEARRIWGVLQQPIRLTDSLWLSVNPTAVRIGVLELRGDTLRTTVGLTGRPRVTAGPRPRPEVRPLPPPQQGGARRPVLHLVTEGRLPYDVATSILTRELRGTTIQVAGQQLTVDSLHLAGVGDGRVLVGLGVSGGVVGLLYAVGHPAYDSSTSKLFMPDLEYDAGTRNLLTGGLAWLGGDAVKQFLRANVRVDLSRTIEDGRRLLEENLNRELARGVRLRSSIQAGQVHDIRAAPEALLVRAVASGRAEILLEPILDGLRGEGAEVAGR